MISVYSIRNVLSSAAVLCMLCGCSVFDSSSAAKAKSDNRYFWQNDGAEEAGLATVAYSQGDFDKAETHVINALEIDPRQRQALMVGGLLYEQLGRPNRARQYYEDIIVYGGDATTILGSSTGTPEKMVDIAKKRLRLININQTKLIVEDENGDKVFNISDEGGKKQRRSAIEEALFMNQQKKNLNREPSSKEQLEAVEVLFDDDEQNIISRFLILKELAEKDLITKEEFITRRMTNVGGLLPLTNNPPAENIGQSVPSPDLIIERIGVLKDAVEARAITPQEFSAERDTIIEALLPANPRSRAKRKSPPKDILEAAKGLRKLEMLKELELITSKEKEKEQKAIENHLGIGKKSPSQEVQAVKKMEIAETKVELADKKTEENQDETKTIIIEEPLEQETISVTSTNALMPEPLVPNVSSPF